MKLIRCLLPIAALAIGRVVYAQSPVGTVANLPIPDGNAYSTSLRYDSAGNLYAWNGLSVWEQSGGSGAFSMIGAAPPGNSADAGPISFSQDGQTALLSNGAGGFAQAGNGIFWTMPAAGGAVTEVPSGVPYAYDALAVPIASSIPGSATKYIVNEGNSSYDGSSMSIFDSLTGANQVVVSNGPGATTNIAVKPQNGSVYVGLGFGPHAGQIFSFTLGQIDNAYKTSTPLDFLSAGTLFNPAATGSQSGAGMFFDNNGYLFSGGGGTTVFRPDGTICFDQSAGSADGNYDMLTFDPARNEVLKVPYNSTTGVLYNAGEFEPGAWTATSGGMGSWTNAANWLLAGVPTSGTANVTFAGTLAAPISVTLDGNQSAGSLAFDVSGSDGYTISQGTGSGTLKLGTSSGASITDVRGDGSISAPVVLEGNLAVADLPGTALLFSGNVSQDAGVTASLNLSGGGTLILSGTNSFSGGVTVDGGRLVVQQPYSLPDGASLTIGDPMALAGSVVGAAGAPQGPTAVPEPSGLALTFSSGLAAFALSPAIRPCRAAAVRLD